MTAITQNFQVPYPQTPPVTIPKSTTLTPPSQGTFRSSPSSSPKEEIDEKIKDIIAKRKLLAEIDKDLDKQQKYFESLSSDSSGDEYSPPSEELALSKSEQTVNLGKPFKHFAQRSSQTHPEPSKLELQILELRLKETLDKNRDLQEKRFNYYASTLKSTSL